MPDSSTRFFFALLVPDEIKPHLRQHISLVRKVYGGNPVIDENLHMTLRYVGITTDATVDCLLSQLSGIEIPAFSIRLHQTSYWRRNRLYVCTPEIISRELMRLVELLESACQNCQLSAETRSFRPHVTLLRKPTNPPEHLIDVQEWKVTKFFLMRSMNIPGGTRYTVVREFGLSED